MVFFIVKRGNGGGSITKLSGKRRKPWRVRVTTGWSPEGKQQYKNIGTFSTKREAEKALSDYFFLPEKPKSIAFKEAYDRWMKQFDGAPDTVKNYQSQFKKMRRIYDVLLTDIDLDIMQEVCDHEPCTYATSSGIHKVLKNVMQWGAAHNYCDQRQVLLLDYVKHPKKEKTKEKIPFSADEIQMAVDENCLGALILIFTGLRRSEILNLTMDRIHLNEQYLEIGEAKTPAGLRTIPIPDGLMPYFKQYIASGSVGRGRTFFYNHHWRDYKCTQDHTFHEARHTYVTILTDAEIDARLIKSIVGHKQTVTEDVYNHYSMQTKLEAVNSVFNKFLPAPVDSDPEGFHQIQA